MQLGNKRALASKVLGVGKERILFADSHLAEIKEAITRQDIRDLFASAAIKVKEDAGRKKVVKRKNRRRTGRIKLKVNSSKQEYVIITRKLRRFSKHLLKTGKIDKEKYKDTEAPLVVFTPAVAPSGMLFYTGTELPQFTNTLLFAGFVDRQRSALFIAQAGDALSNLLSAVAVIVDG